MDKSKELQDIERVISEVYMVYSAEREKLDAQYEVDRQCIFDTNTEKAQELFNEKYPTRDKYIEANKKIKTIYDAYLILDLVSKNNQ